MRGRGSPSFADKESVAMHRSILFRTFPLFVVVVCTLAIFDLQRPQAAIAQTKPDAIEAKTRPEPANEEDEAKAKPRPALAEPVGAQRLSPRYPIWIDKKAKEVLVDGQICLREGMLEMFACTRNTK